MSLKIFYFANVRLPTEKAHGLQIMKTCEALAGAGAEVDLIVSSKVNRQLQHLDAFEYYGIKKNYKLTRLSAPDPHWLMSFPQGWYIKFQALFFIGALIIFIKKNHPPADAIAYTRDEYLLPVLQRYFKKVIWEGHNLPQRRGYYKKFWRACYRVLVLTNGLKDALVRLGVTGDAIAVVPDAVDLALFQHVPDKMQCRKVLGLPADKKLVLYTGHLYEWKGAGILAQAARRFLDNPALRDSVEFVFVGGTEHDLLQFQKIVSDLALTNVRIIGQRPHVEIPRWLTAADVLVLPNSQAQKISRLYTSPMKLFEYMASGVPLLASDLPSLREIIDETCATFFTPGDAASLSQALQKILADPASYQARARIAQTAVTRYSWDQRAEKILEHIL